MASCVVLIEIAKIRNFGAIASTTLICSTPFLTATVRLACGVSETKSGNRTRKEISMKNLTNVFSVWRMWYINWLDQSNRALFGVCVFCCSDVAAPRTYPTKQSECALSSCCQPVTNHHLFLLASFKYQLTCTLGIAYVLYVYNFFPHSEVMLV